MSSEENIIVASVSVLRNGEVFMIQEKKASAYGLWNFPSGRGRRGKIWPRPLFGKLRRRLDWTYG